MCFSSSYILTLPSTSFWVCLLFLCFFSIFHNSSLLCPPSLSLPSIIPFPPPSLSLLLKHYSMPPLTSRRTLLEILKIRPQDSFRRPFLTNFITRPTEPCSLNPVLLPLLPPHTHLPTHQLCQATRYPFHTPTSHAKAPNKLIRTHIQLPAMSSHSKPLHTSFLLSIILSPIIRKLNQATKLTFPPLRHLNKSSHPEATPPAKTTNKTHSPLPSQAAGALQLSNHTHAPPHPRLFFVSSSNFLHLASQVPPRPRLTSTPKIKRKKIEERRYKRKEEKSRDRTTGIKADLHVPFFFSL